MYFISRKAYFSNPTQPDLWAHQSCRPAMMSVFDLPWKLEFNSPLVENDPFTGDQKFWLVDRFS